MCMLVDARLARSVLKAQQVSISGGTRSDIGSSRLLGALQPGKRRRLSIHSGFLIRYELCANSESVLDRGWTRKGVQDSCRGSAGDRHSRVAHAAARTRILLELVSCCKCGCGKFRCVAAEIMTRNEAGGVD